MEIIPNGILIFDIKKKTITYANHELFEMTGSPTTNLSDPRFSRALEYESLVDKLCNFKEHERLQNSKSSDYNNPDKAASMAGIKFLTKEEAEALAAAPDTPKSEDNK